MVTKTLNLRLTDEELKRLEELAKGVELNRSALGGYFIRAALRAIARANRRLKLPPEFELLPDCAEVDPQMDIGEVRKRPVTAPRK